MVARVALRAIAIAAQTISGGIRSADLTPSAAIILRGFGVQKFSAQRRRFLPAKFLGGKGLDSAYGPFVSEAAAA